MDQHELQQRFATLTTAHLADACIRAQLSVRCAPTLLQGVVPGARLAGRVCPVRHAGSVEVFLEAFETATAGDVLVVDNAGRGRLAAQAKSSSAATLRSERRFPP